MVKNTDEINFFESKSTLSYVLKTLRSYYNNGFFQPTQKSVIHNLMKDIELTLKKVSK
jgi:hypothetical protein